MPLVIQQVQPKANIPMVFVQHILFAYKMKTRLVVKGTWGKSEMCSLMQMVVTSSISNCYRLRTVNFTTLFLVYIWGMFLESLVV